MAVVEKPKLCARQALHTQKASPPGNARRRDGLMVNIVTDNELEVCSVFASLHCAVEISTSRPLKCRLAVVDVDV